MPYSGEGTEEEIRQRQQAARKSGAYAIRDRGEDAMSPPQRSKRIEMLEQLGDRAGVLNAMIDKAADQLVMCAAAEAWVARQATSGVPLGDIALLRALPAFWNSCNRALAAIYVALPDDDKTLDIGEMIKKAVENHEQNT
jgi:hypothetical protein